MNLSPSDLNFILAVGLIFSALIGMKNAACGHTCPQCETKKAEAAEKAKRDRAEFLRVQHDRWHGDGLRQIGPVPSCEHCRAKAKAEKDA